MLIYTWIIAACWLVFILYWLIAALSAKRTVRRNWSWTLSRIALVVIIVLLAHVGALNNTNIWAPTTATTPLLGVLGSALTILGIGLAVWARIYLGRNWGMPMSHKENPELVTSGPYATIRHPIYTGVLLALLGSALVSGLVWLIFFVFAAAYFIYSATQEEKRMQAEFPAQYPAYKARTNMLVPFIF